MSAPGLECRQLRLERKDAQGEPRVILDDVSARFEPGTLSLITGRIGSGKTTLLHLLSTILRPTSGEVLADGEVISRYAAVHRDRWRRQAGLAFQLAHFLDELSVLENVMVPLIPAAPSLGEAHAQALVELERLGILALAGRRLAGLSGGERQRITLARALVNQPRFVFADEPTAHQDEAGSRLIIERLAELARGGATVVVVSHDPRLAQAAVADQHWVMADGRLGAPS